MIVVTGLVQSVLGGLIVAAILSAIPNVRHAVARFLSAGRDRIAGIRERREQRERRRLIAELLDEGVVVPVRHRGHTPTVVTFSNGSEAAYFSRDLVAYKRAIESGQYPWASTHPLRAPPALLTLEDLRTRVQKQRLAARQRDYVSRN